MSMTTDVIKKFVEEEYKDFVIEVTCDNEHRFYHNAAGKPPIIWDWTNEVFMVLEPNHVVNDQNKHPMQITKVALEEIQFLTAYVDKVTVLKFINDNITDEDKKKETKEYLQKLAPAMMGPKTLRKNISDPEYRE